MNERILELAIKAQELAGEQHHTGRALDLKGMEQVPDFQIFMDRVHTSYEKFAELLIQECIDAVENSNDRHRRDYFAGKIRERFGIDQ